MSEERFDFIIVGAGISGLTVTRELCRGGKNVLVLEADSRIGGRIHTAYNENYVLPFELSAEFIHGKLPHTLRLLGEYNISYSRVKGAFFRVHKGKLKKDSNIIEDAGDFEKKLRAQEEDISVKEFLDRYFPDKEHDDLRMSAQKFVEGYDAADITKASILALKKEWLSEEWDQFRVAGGYVKMVDALAADIRKYKGKIILQQPVKEIHWGEHSVSVKTSEGKIYRSVRIVLTVPLGILQHTGKASISFFPALPEKHKAALQLGFGSVIKIILQFNEAFWKEDNHIKNLGFIFSYETIPTWWAQLPDPAPILTGWVGGPPAVKLSSATEQEILETALKSLASVFNTDPLRLKMLLAEYKISDWGKHPYSLGAYSYTTVDSQKYIDQLEAPVADTIYFAGEVFSAENTGTVEAALTSAFKTVDRIIK